MQIARKNEIMATPMCRRKADVGPISAADVKPTNPANRERRGHESYGMQARPGHARPMELRPGEGRTLRRYGRPGHAGKGGHEGEGLRRLLADMPNQKLMSI